jgi:hypothetical protein
MYKNQSPTPNLSQTNLVRTLFLKIHFNIIFHRQGVQNGPFPSGFTTKIMYVSLISQIGANFPANFLITRISTVGSR